MTTSVIISGARTPIGRLLGALSGFSAPELGGVAIRAALEKSGVAPEDIDAVLFGNVVQAGVGPNAARQASVAGGLGFGVPATTINKLCLSGMTAIAQADQMIRLGYYDTIVAGGCESMTNAPHEVLGSRKGIKYGPGKIVDALDQDGLICAFEGLSMGAATERHQKEFGFTREMQDEFAASSHERAANATKNGLLAEEIVPVIDKKGNIALETDEGVRPGTTTESLGGLRPAFDKEGTITPGNASQLSDGAAAVIVMSKDKAEKLGLTWIAEILSYGTVAGPDTSLINQPANAINDALRREGSLTVSDLDLIEINEAFAGVALGSMQTLGVSSDRVNVNGGAIALGHPVGMSGTRVVLTLANELRRRGGGIGAAALCGGGGQGDGLIIRV
jgi:acetyl-CoA C-acetyltransferase